MLNGHDFQKHSINPLIFVLQKLEEIIQIDEENHVEIVTRAWWNRWFLFQENSILPGDGEVVLENGKAWGIETIKRNNDPSFSFLDNSKIDVNFTAMFHQLNVSINYSRLLYWYYNVQINSVNKIFEIFYKPWVPN